MCKDCDTRVSQTYDGYITQKQADEELAIRRKDNIDYYGEYKHKKLPKDRRGVIKEATSLCE